MLGAVRRVFKKRNQFFTAELREVYNLVVMVRVFTNWLIVFPHWEIFIERGLPELLTTFLYDSIILGWLIL